MSRSRWNLLPPAPQPLLDAAGGLPPLVVQLLYNRGITDPATFPAFLESSRSLAADPLLLPDMEKAVGRIYRALLSGENMAVYGDFDADGITATVTLVGGLKALGGNAVPYIPHRQTEGHGLDSRALKNLRQQGVTLVISVDCGVTDIAEVARAKRLGMDVVITDHHSPLPELPAAAAVVDPKLPGGAYPCPQLAGVGVAYKLLQALNFNLGKGDRADAMLDMVAIGTIADMSPLVGENRYLVTEGLKAMNASPRLGLRELMQATSLEPGKLDEDRIGWVIAPCLNAAGRLADGLTGYHLLMTDDEAEAQRLAAWLKQKNEERQRLTAKTLETAREQVIAKGLPALLIAGDREHPMGISGLVAGRLTEEFYRPAIVIQVGEKESHASCRSIPEFDIIAALNEFGSYFTRYGGHAQAAGFTMPTKDLPAVEEGLSELAAAALAGVELRPHLDIDAEVALSDLAGDTYPAIQRLAPFGMGNPVPKFVSKGVTVLERRTMGNGGDHLRLKLKQGNTVWDCVGFRQGAYFEELTPQIDIVYNLEIDRWQGKENLRLNILDFEAVKP